MPSIILLAFILGTIGSPSLVQLKDGPNMGEEKLLDPVPVQKYSRPTNDAVNITGSLKVADLETGEVLKYQNIKVKTETEEYTQESVNAPPEKYNRTIRYLSESRDINGSLIGKQVYAAKSERAVYNATSGNYTHKLGVGSQRADTEYERSQRADSGYGRHDNLLHKFLWPVRYRKVETFERDGEEFANYTVDEETSPQSLVSGKGYLLLRNDAVLTEANITLTYRSPETGEGTKWYINYDRRKGGLFHPPEWVRENQTEKTAKTNNNATVLLHPDRDYIRLEVNLSDEYSRYDIPTGADYTLVTDQDNYTVKTTDYMETSDVYLFVQDGELTIDDEFKKDHLTEKITSLGQPEKLIVTNGEVTFIDQPVKSRID